MSGDPYSRYFYEGTETFTNKLGILNSEELRVFEYEWTHLHQTEALTFARQADTLDELTLQGIHKILFGDIYSWAGQWRTIALHKDQTTFQAAVSTERMHAICQTFTENSALHKDKIGPFAGALARLWGSLNHEHPFVEGNGRATQILLTVAAERSGWKIDWAKVTRANEMDAAIQSCMLSMKDRRFNAYHDLLMRVLQPLHIPEHDTNQRGPQAPFNRSNLTR